MSDTLRPIELVARGLAVLALVVAILGLLALSVVGLHVAAESGVAVPVPIDASTAQLQTLLVVGLGALFGGFLTYLLANTVASFLAGFRDSPAASRTADAPSGSERFRRRLQRTYLVLAGFVGLLVALSVVAGTRGSTFGGGPLEVALAVARLLLSALFGGVGGGAVAMAVMLGLWYGIRQAAREAVLASVGLGGLFLLGSLASLLTGATAGAFGFVFFGATLVYYSLFALNATEFVVLEGLADSSPDAHPTEKP